VIKIHPVSALKPLTGVVAPGVMVTHISDENSSGIVVAMIENDVASVLWSRPLAPWRSMPLARYPDKVRWTLDEARRAHEAREIKDYKVEANINGEIVVNVVEFDDDYRDDQIADGRQLHVIKEKRW
jgi:hypothetical protein